MVKHVVQFQFRQDVDAQTKQEVMNKFKAAILALPQTISFIRSIEVGFNINPAEKWDVCLICDLDSLDDVNAYAVHPDHVAAAGIIKPYLSGRSCVDYVC